jgi:hypothetical protein
MFIVDFPYITLYIIGMSNQYTKQPTPITAAQFESICNEIELTDESVDYLCKNIGVSNRSFYQYIKIVGELAQQKYAQARSAQLENLAHEIRRIDDECLKIVLDENYDPKSKNAIVQAYKLKSDNLKWQLSKLVPKKYGDKIGVDLSGGLQINISDLSPKVNQNNQ